jgi:SAM-dependent methyltransferase
MKFIKTYESFGSPLLKLSNNEDEHLMSVIESLVDKGSSILEISCGNAADSLYLQENGYKVTCTDLNKDYCDNAVYKGLNCIQHDTKNKFPFSDNEFDLVYSRLGLHYFSEDELTEIFRELRRIGKKILFTVKYEESEGLNVFGQQNTEKVFLDMGQWKKIISKFFTIGRFDSKEGMVYGSPSKWLEVEAE